MANAQRHFATWKEAHTEAVLLAREIGCDVGLEKTATLSSNEKFHIFLLPKPQHRSGFELRCEVVKADDPL